MFRAPISCSNIKWLIPAPTASLRLLLRSPYYLPLFLPQLKAAEKHLTIVGAGECPAAKDCAEL
eukprot:COSAG02_NODE_50094_length_322_cov_1.600897_1_plen_63_part_10